MRPRKGNAVSGRSPNKVYLRKSHVEVTMYVTGARGSVEAYLLGKVFQCRDHNQSLAMNMLTHLMAALTALWLIWPETPPESKVSI